MLNNDDDETNLYGFPQSGRLLGPVSDDCLKSPRCPSLPRMFINHDRHGGMVERKKQLSPAPLFVQEIENFGSVPLLILGLAASCLATHQLDTNSGF